MLWDTFWGLLLLIDGGNSSKLVVLLLVWNVYMIAKFLVYGLYDVRSYQFIQNRKPLFGCHFAWTIDEKQQETSMKQK